MMLSRLSSLLLLLSVALSVSGFAVTQQTSSIRSTTELKANRRDVLSLAGAAIVTGFAVPSWADVSDGNTLPQGALQFSRLIRVKSDLKVRMSTGRGE
jgi:hypothetical protein